MTVKEVLKLARAKLAKRGAWCQKRFAQDRNGMCVYERDGDAVKWCARGVLDAVTEDWTLAETAGDQLRIALGSQDLTGFNDTHTKKEVLELFDKAIAKKG